ncbi:MAG: TniB family NTP-binding protein [Cyanobacteria bacterium P01_G01_bin.4]
MSESIQATAELLGEMETPSADLEAEIARLRRKQFVALEHVRQMHKWLENMRCARESCRIVGPSRTGKTEGCKVYQLRVAKLTEDISGQAPHIKVAYVLLPKECGSRDLFYGILGAVQFQATRGTIADLRQRVFRVLERCQLEMLILDEANHLKANTFAEVRHISDLLGVSVVLVGTERLNTLIRRDEQVHNRFRASYRLGRLVGDDFERTVRIWERDLLKLPAASNLHSKGAMKVLWKETHGCIGLLDQILRRAAIVALQQGKSRISVDLLKQVALGYEQ